MTRAIVCAALAGALLASAPLFAQGFGVPIMDITGHWATRQHEDQEERRPQDDASRPQHRANLS